MNYKLITDPILRRQQYSELYYSLCYEKQKLGRKKHQGLYLEDHHIIPKCMGGKKNKENMVFLTGREHFLVHKLLVHMFEGKEKRSMANALQRMCNKAKNNTGRIILTALEYEKVRIIVSEAMSGENSPRFGKSNYDLWIEKYGLEEANRRQLKAKENQKLGMKKFYAENPEEKIKQYERLNKPENRKKQGETMKRLHAENPELGKKISDGVKRTLKDDPSIREKMSEAGKKRFKNPETRKKQSIALKKAYDENPDFRKNASERNKKRYKDPEARKKLGEGIKNGLKTPEAKQRRSEANKGSNNPMAGRSVFEVWVEKYGLEQANKRKEENSKKISEANKKRHQRNRELKLLAISEN